MNRDVFDEYYPKIYNYIYYRVLHRETAEDLTSETFYKAVAFAASFDERKASYKTWIFTLAHNVVANYYRGRKNDSPIDDFEFADDEAGVDESLIVKEDMKKLHGLLKTLPKREREVLALRYWGDMSYRDIAERTGISEKNVGVILSRTITKLKNSW